MDESADIKSALAQANRFLADGKAEVFRAAAVPCNVDLADDEVSSSVTGADREIMTVFFEVHYRLGEVLARIGCPGKLRGESRLVRGRSPWPASPNPCLANHPDNVVSARRRARDDGREILDS